MSSSPPEARGRLAPALLPAGDGVPHAGGIVILRILHEAMEPNRHLGAEHAELAALGSLPATTAGGTGRSGMRRTVMWVLVICGLATAQGGVAADPVPNLVGTWSGGGVGVGKQDGWADDPVTLVIIEQRERAFTGRKTHSEGEEGFFGAILADGRNLLLTDDGDGYSIGSILDTGFDRGLLEAGADAQVFCEPSRSARRQVGTRWWGRSFRAPSIRRNLLERA